MEDPELAWLLEHVPVCTQNHPRSELDRIVRSWLSRRPEIATYDVAVKGGSTSGHGH